MTAPLLRVLERPDLKDRRSLTRPVRALGADLAADEFAEPHVVICRDPDDDMPTITRGVFPDAVAAWQYAEGWRERLAAMGIKLDITVAILLPPSEDP